jgi:hypothetical protein
LLAQRTHRSLVDSSKKASGSGGSQGGQKTDPLPDGKLPEHLGVLEESGTPSVNAPEFLRHESRRMPIRRAEPA